MLSVQVPPAATIWMLGPGRLALHELLRAIPHDLELWKATEKQIGRNSRAWQLWELLRNRTNEHADAARRGTGPVTTSKLLARKRPHLIPIQDSVVAAALGGRAEDFWSNMHDAMSESGFRDRLASIRAQAHQREPAVPSRLSLLRGIDIIVWLQSQPA